MKADPNYGSPLYARILIYLRDSGQWKTVKTVCIDMIGEHYTKTDRQRIRKILNNMTDAGMLTRVLEDGDRKHVQRYIYQYNDEL